VPQKLGFEIEDLGGQLLKAPRKMLILIYYLRLQCGQLRSLVPLADAIFGGCDAVSLQSVAVGGLRVVHCHRRHAAVLALSSFSGRVSLAL
jgi:hypothetical protein